MALKTPFRTWTKDLKTKIKDQAKIKIMDQLFKIKIPLPAKIKIRALFLLLPKTKAKNHVLRFLGAGSFQIRLHHYPRRGPTNSVSNWRISRHLHEFCRPPSASGLPRKPVFWPASSSMIPVSTTFSYCSAYRPWQSLLPPPGTEQETWRTGLACTRMCPCPTIILTVRRVRRRTQRSSPEL